MKKLFLILFLLVNFLYAKVTISKTVYTKLQKAQDLSQKEKYKEEKAILLPLLNSKNSLAKSYALQGLTNIALTKENYKQVAKYYEEILTLKALDKKDLDRIKYSLCQIYLSQEKYKKALNYTKDLQNSKTIKKEDLYNYFAYAYYYLKEYKQAIIYIQKNIKIKEDKESWYRMLYSAQIEEKKYNNAISTLKTMIKLYNKENYWLQLISLYQNTKKYKKALASMEIAFEKNYIQQKKNILYFINILLQNELYNKTALLIKNSLDKKILSEDKRVFELYISSLINAKEYKKAIKKLELSQFANNDKYKLILGNIYFNNSAYKKTIKLLKNYKFKKRSKKDGQKYILLALSAHELNKKEESIKYLKKASLNPYEKKRALNLARDLSYKL